MARDRVQELIVINQPADLLIVSREQVNAMMRQVFQITRFRAEEKSLSPRIKAEAPRGYVRGDERKLRQVLLNGLGNAV